jgi:REP element-mobilizing transposase RayT
MTHSLCRIWIHGVWSTKYLLPLVKPEIEKEIHSYLYKQFYEMRCPARIINGIENHIHSLFLLSPSIAVSDLMKQVKGSSSRWIDKEKLSDDKFAWQIGYGAFSVSESDVPRIIRYIENQKEHHKRISFSDENDLLEGQ